MKRNHMALLLVLAMVLLVLAGGCGKAKNSTGTTTAAATTTEAATTADAGAEPTLRTLDLDDPANAAIKSWLSELAAAEQPSEYPLSNGKTILTKETGIFLRDDATQRETALMEAKISETEETNEYPRVAKLIDNRFFVYVLQGYEEQAGAGVYDMEQMKAIPISSMQKKGFTDSYSYQTVCGETLYLHGPVHNTAELGPLQVYAVDLRLLDKADALVPGADLLKGVPEAKFEELKGECYGSAFSPDGRYCAVQAEQVNSAVPRNGIVAVFDLQEKAFVFQMEKPANMKDYQHITFDENNTLYVFHKTHDETAQQYVPNREVLEITLP